MATGQHNTELFVSVADVLTHWRTLKSGDTPPGARECLNLGRRAIELGQPTLGLDILRFGLQQDPNDAVLACRAAQAAAKSGSTRLASAYLRGMLPNLERESEVFVEALSLAGRIAKDRWLKLPDGVERAAAAAESAQAYRHAWDETHDPFPGINAATMSCLAGDLTTGKQLAAEVLARCTGESASDLKRDHWLDATLGEACLLLGRFGQATTYYIRAVAEAGSRHGDIGSMVRQLELLETFLPVPDATRQALTQPAVVVFTGHMIDSPTRDEPRFPPGLENVVAEAIEKQLGRINAGFGYCAAACGADILFIEAMQARGAETNIVLPFNREDFLRTSVSFAGSDWIKRFDRVMDNAAHVSYGVGERFMGDDILFEYGIDLTLGMGLLRGQQIHTEVVLLSVLENETKPKPGGSAATVELWEDSGHKVSRIDLGVLRKKAENDGRIRDPDHTRASREMPAVGGEHPAWGRRKIRTMLFADMVGYSKLKEEMAPNFFVHFLSQVEEVVRSGSAQPVFSNTWGDGLFMVFRSVTEGADFALRLREKVTSMDWTSMGLPESTNIRIGMHTGPVFPAHDPIIDRTNYFGTHVNRAARIEPVADVGAVYVSEQMASLLVASGETEYACDYLGIMELAKEFDSSPLYRLRRSHQEE